ncbi:MAG TPA: MMPL family transporter [Streptosporangiaceae bacterium]|nr:MMPL family transporter [Streptosporangiaceae bacterium]
MPKTTPPRTAEPDPRSRPVIERIAGWSVRHRKTAVLGWFLLVAAVFLIGQHIGTSNVNSYDPGQSGQAERTLDRLHVKTAPAAETVLIQARNPAARFATDPALRRAAADVVAALHGLPRSSASGIGSPLGPGGGSLISADGRSALVTFKVIGRNATQAVLPAIKAVASVQATNPQLRIRESGDASSNRVADATISRDFHQAETTSLPITLILLLLVFGALIAAGIPLLLAATAVISAISLASVVGQWLPVGQSTSEVILIIGMAVGVDYSLFYLRREREERARGASLAEALRIAAATSGRAIVVSGLTVMVALAGLFITGVDVFTGIAIGTIAVVGITVVGSLTVLPALLSWLGKWADRGRIPFLGRRRTASKPSAFWTALVTRVMRRPAVWGGLAAIAMIALALPAFGLKLANPPYGGFSTNLPLVKTLADTQRAFPQAPSPAQVVVTGSDLASPSVSAAVVALRHDASATGLLRPPVTTQLVAGGRALIIDVQLAGNGTNANSNRALLALRDRVLPETFGKVSGISYAVSGGTANNYDEIHALDTRTPLVLGAVALLAFLLLLFAFRSVPISLLSVGLNLLSVAASYGLIVLIFQDGRLQGPIGYTGYGGIVPWVPLFMFVFLFGLSMDYHVFILSRIAELRAGGASTRQAVIGGISTSSGVVTSAAVIMVAVFSILATLSIIQLQTLGIGLAAAVLIDATVVRGILLPAALALLGERSWYLPRWLSWLPGRKTAVPELSAQ